MRFILYLSLILPLNIFAADTSEKDQLMKIHRELDYLKHLVSEAQTHSDNGSRVRFDYQALELDIKQIQLGIEDYVHTRERQSISPIQAEYQK